ncbi:hypothetical protein N7536_011028 [Penicillium majusculum]|nr:hypothetical protein N7536_011028 [Penicillium majusculum]
MSQLGHGSYEDWSLGSNMPGSMEPETRDHLVLIQISMKTARQILESRGEPYRSTKRHRSMRA